MFRLKSTENILMSLLKNRQDIVAAKYGGNFLECVNITKPDEKGRPVKTCELILFAFRNQNEQFLKYAFREAFDGPALYTTEVFSHQIIKEEILLILN